MILHLHDRLKSFNNLPEFGMDDEDEGGNLSTPFGSDSKDGSYSVSPVSVVYSVMKGLEEEDPLLDESLSLKNLGLSDVCLATLATEGDGKTDDLDMCFQETMNFRYDQNNLHDTKDPNELTAEIEGELQDKPQSNEASTTAIKVSKDDYESQPSYIRNLASWEDLLVAVEKINASLRKKVKGSNYFQQDEIASLDLGPKARSYLLLLTRVNQLQVEIIDGLICYRAL